MHAPCFLAMSERFTTECGQPRLLTSTCYSALPVLHSAFTTNSSE
jgi:hypothetical protein